MRAQLPDIVVHWFSPLPPRQTDIAHYTARTLKALAAKARVVLWSDHPGWDPALERHAAVVRLFDPDALMSADLDKAGRDAGATGRAIHAPFIHIGNSWVFHAGLIRLARRLPSVVVMHDLAIQEMLVDSVWNQLFSRKQYITDMQRFYGAGGLAAVEDTFANKCSAGEWAPQMPGFELALPCALATLSHTQSAHQALEQAGGPPAFMLELPFNPSPHMPPPRAAQGPLRLAQFGYIGPNRRLLSVLDALGNLADTVPFEFDLMGQIWAPDLIRDKVKALGLEQRVRIRGFVPEPELDDILAKAHLVFNLRNPTLGEASGSQVRIWNAGAASIVTEAGWYAGLPRDTVFHIPADLEGEVANIQRVITSVHQNRACLDGIREKGRARLFEHHHPDAYAASIVKIAQDMPQLARAYFARNRFQVITRGPTESDAHR